ncbi:hypothetical protein GWI33_018720 [Rhynchophorus ferrugineus]|uniref:Uncharacterized protein n=1 Tax=Rhynchophorus ferrugineus TaxID=354439 RepID=A0A834HVS6_RHYFE|nr:hypothetical protein GWI33_018720 [Rhynchophorus ferrugineus]
MDNYAPQERAEICLTKPQFIVHMRIFNSTTAERLVLEDNGRLVTLKMWLWRAIALQSLCSYTFLHAV